MPNNLSRMAVIVFVLVVLVGVISACSFTAPSTTAIPPTPQPAVNAAATAVAPPTEATDVTAVAPVQYEEGKALVAETCTGCHDLGRISSARKTRAEWVTTVDKMVTV